jgi:hypothetical protein
MKKEREKYENAKKNNNKKRGGKTRGGNKKKCLLFLTICRAKYFFAVSQCEIH